MDGDKLPNPVPVSDAGFAVFTVILQILWSHTNRRAGAEEIIFNNHRPAIDRDTCHQARARAHCNLWSDDRERSDISIRMSACCGINDCGWMYRHRQHLVYQLRRTS